MLLTDLPTPFVIVDRARVLANIERMQAAAVGGGLRMRPHAKTHKLPAIARWQIERGAIGICCAKLGEAEVFADAGITDIRLPYPINPFNAPRVLALMDRVALSIVVDHPVVAETWSTAMRNAGRQLDVLVKVDVGFHRCGVPPQPEQAVPFVQHVAAQAGLRLRGVLSHAGQAYLAGSEDELASIAAAEAQMLTTVADAARARGIEIAEISVGATPTARFSVQQPHLTELRAGNYVYYDRTQVGLGAAALADCALMVMATVVSKPAEDRIVLDCGSKTLSSDGARGFGGAAGYGVVLDAGGIDETLLVDRLSEEHATVKVLSGTTALVPGDRVRVLPNHSCVVSNLVNEVHLVDGMDVVESLPVAARGRIA